MADTVVVPVAEEVLIDRHDAGDVDLYPVVGTWPAWGDWVGDAGIFLDEPDEDAKFGRILDGAAEGVAFRGIGLRFDEWVPPDPFDPIRIYMNYQASSITGDPLRFRLGLRTTHTGPSSLETVNLSDETSTSGWVTGQVEFGLSLLTHPIVSPIFLGALAEGSLLAFANAVDADGVPYSGPFKVSWLQLVFELAGDIPLRQFPRDDGATGGAPSARPTSQQSTTAQRTHV